MEFVGGQVWDEIRGQLRHATRRRAAIAFTGSSAATVLPLKRGDTIVVNGDDEALASGATNPDSLAAWLAAGVVVRSHPDLHAKIILVEYADERRTAIVGSANASANSRDRLIEAALLTDDASVCDAVSAQLDIWATTADRIDERWLARARLVYREPRPRQLGGARVRFAPADRAFLAALVHRLPRHVLHQIRLVVRPETVLRWHRDVVAAHHARISTPKRVGRPRTVRPIRVLVLRLARENGSWG